MKDHKQHLNETIVKVNNDLINALQEIKQLKKENAQLKEFSNIIICPGCNGDKESIFGKCAGCNGKGFRTKKE